MRSVLASVAMLVASCSRSSGSSAPEAGGLCLQRRRAHSPTPVRCSRAATSRRFSARTISSSRSRPGVRAMHCARGPLLRAAVAWSFASTSPPARRTSIAATSSVRRSRRWAIAPTFRATWGRVDVLRGEQTFYVQVEHGRMAGSPPREDPRRGHRPGASHRPEDVNECIDSDESRHYSPKSNPIIGPTKKSASPARLGAPGS